MISYFEKKMRNMSLIEHAIRTTFSNLDDETKRRLIDEFTIDCYGIRVATISCIADNFLSCLLYTSPSPRD